MPRFAPLLVALTVCFAARLATAASLELPGDPSLWINSPPVSLESLRGKGVVLYFFEEQCPRCSGQWPELVRLQSKYADKPVVFVGISSGTDRASMEQYVRRNGVSWPVVLDPTRELERSAGTDQISLQNIMQYRIITAEGQMKSGSWQDVPGTVENALAGAAWRVDPKDIPPTLKPAWQAIELGNFALASAPIKKALTDKKPEVKGAAEKLQVAAEASLAEEIATAQKQADASDNWATFKAFRAIAERYKGYTLPDDFKSAGSALFKDEAVQRELAAFADLEALKKGLASKSPSVYRKSFDKLDKVIADHPNTEAASMAAEFKESLKR